ncbi:hypothetical protein CBI30_09575 [Polynucleobacter aenigmaticus]|uniref:Uncharacterized protein n=1 Tax=Polynucleobacter aenigmaticus TaxID=1743164 RepID=A0A254PSA1_9BURK|nr:AAA family ATPase [Polynucleobacter aenigmaticus]OWS69415.1 hypothetical protein CBI30_09575 [Polynucleobacter aenigmaticus]
MVNSGKALLKSEARQALANRPMVNIGLAQVQEMPNTSAKKKIDWRADLSGLSTTEELMKDISDIQFCWMRLLVQGHLTVIVAKGNGGKTTVMIQACAEMVKEDYEIFYVNVDASADQLKGYHDHARENGYTLLAPDLHVGKSANDVVEMLFRMSKADENYAGTVLVLDTLKKFAEMMNKKLAKDFYSMLRSLTAKGMTVICLAHTNKYDDKDGKPIFEGVGDLRNDFDELMYFIPVKNDDGSLVVSTLLDKIRATGMMNYTFDITKDRQVTTRDKFEDTMSLHQIQAAMEVDRELIDFIFDSITMTSKSINEIYEEAKSQGMPFGRDKIRRVATAYSSDKCKQPLWLAIATGRNGSRYGLITDAYKEELSRK